MAHPGGRPTTIGTIVARRTDPTTGHVTKITAADRILELIRAGNYFEVAAAAAGVERETAYEWRRRGARTIAALEAGKIAWRDVPTADRRLVEFSDAVAEAEAEWEASANVLLEQIARGGLVAQTITVKVDASGSVLERTERTETLLPDAKVLLARLGQRFPERYRKRVEITGADGGPLIDEDRVRRLLDVAREIDGGAEG